MRSILMPAALGFLSLAVTITLFAQSPVSPEEIGKLVTQDATALRAILAKAKVEKKAQNKAKIAALLIAHYAQNLAKENPKSAETFATLRDRALSVIQALDDGKLDDARKLAASLKVDIKAEPGVKTAPAALSKSLDLDSLMKVFAAERHGGFGLQNQLEDLGELKGTLDGDQADKLIASAEKTALIATLANGYAPPKDPEKTQKKWAELNQEMVTASRELADAARGKQAPAIIKAAAKLNDVCARCHGVYR